MRTFFIVGVHVDKYISITTIKSSVSYPTIDYRKVNQSNFLYFQDDLGILANGYVPGTADVAYPDVPYAPGYYYDSGYGASNK